jgi:hypothetical protein
VRSISLFSIYWILVGLLARMASYPQMTEYRPAGFRDGVVADLSPDVLGVLENRSSQIAAAETLGVISLR